MKPSKIKEYEQLYTGWRPVQATNNRYTALLTAQHLGLGGHDFHIGDRKATCQQHQHTETLALCIHSSATYEPPDVHAYFFGGWLGGGACGLGGPMGRGGGVAGPLGGIMGLV